MRLLPASEAFLDLMLLALLHGTSLVLLTWLLSSTLLRRCRPSIHAALWTVVLVKFLLPPVLPGDFGLSPALARLLPSGSSITRPPGESPNRPAELNTAEPASQPERQREPRRGWPAAVLLVAYVALVSLFGARALLQSYRVKRRIDRLPAPDGELAAEVATAAARFGMRRPPRVRCDAAATGPFVVGVWSPTLVMPASLPARIGARAREALIIHELAHVRRGDTLVRWLRNAARLLFFFWPPVWWLCRRVERFSEMACDEWAVRLSSVSARVYAESLLDVAKAARAGGAPLCQQVGFASRDAGLLADRFEMILGRDHRKPPRLTALTTAALIVWGLFALAGRVSSQPSRGAPAGVPAVEALRVAQAYGQATRGGEDDSNRRAERASRKMNQERAAARARASARRQASDDDAPAAESPHAGAPAVRQSRQPEQKRIDQTTGAAGVDLNGDGAISDFEAGYSAGLRHRRRGAGRGGAAADADTTARRGPEADAELLRRSEIELRERRRRLPANDMQ